MEGSRSRNRNKMFQCKICDKSVRSDNLRRHLRTHKNLMTASTKESCEEIRARYMATLERGEKQKEVCQEGVPSDSCTEATSSSPAALADTDFRDFLLQNSRIYRDSIDLGEKVADILNEWVQNLKNVGWSRIVVHSYLSFLCKKYATCKLLL